ncbi:APC family permease [Cryobacterium psychrophilum]|uniref:APC family permease n=1 Tax=Cryobacterium psychrophilum TaxID=41988 RepID=A0A4Y8KT20_9MICO|nr:APC family permease [Cryobacterium psychrophilum]TDW29379.1 amino acid/polyamine/organocation transporter (APC superfamily) [Cryobacterium psychrophilum]TFD81474.1 APC family permease [Cryobacterium psychrophilum]
MTALSQAPTRADSPAAERSLTGSLGTAAIVMMVVAAAAPLTVVGGAAPLGILLGNGVGFPAMYAISAVVLFLFAVGLSAMTRHVPKPGAFFTFVGYGLGRPAGLATAFLALLTYTAIQVSVHGYVGYILSVTVTGLGGPDLPWYLYSLATILLVGILGYRHIDLSSKVLGVLLVAEVAIVLALVAAVTFSGGPEGLSLAPFEPNNVLSGSPGIGLMFAIAAFIGFEATAIFRDEAKDPARTIPRATYIAVIGIGVFYTLASWSLVMAWGPSGVLAQAAEDPGAMILITTLKFLGPIGEVIMNVLLITSMFACVLSFHNVITRYQHSMSNAKVLPDVLGSVHHKHFAPHVSSVVQTTTAAVLVAIFAVLGLDPVLEVFTWFAGVATLAIAILMAITSLAVIVFFARTGTDKRIWNTKIAPALGLIGLAGSAVVIAVNFPMLVSDVNADGAPAFGMVSAVLLGIIVLFPAIGLVQAAVLKRTDRVAYDNMTEAISG